MVKQAGAASGSAVAGIAIAVAAVAAAGMAWYVQRPQAPAAPVPLVSPQSGPSGQGAAAFSSAPTTIAQPDQASTETQAPTLPAPTFDTVRVTPEGQALVAGRAAPAATVVLRVDGAETARTTADGQGSFVAMFDLPPSDLPRLLSLVQLNEGGAEIAAPETVALAPTVAPAEVLAAATTAEAPAEVAAAAESPVEEPPASPPRAAPLLLTDQGALALQPISPGSVSIGTISYTPAGEVQLAGQGDGGAVVRLYLDNAPVAEALVAASGQWFTTLRDTAPGLYTLRVDQLDAAGKVSARFETPFLRETTQALAAAMKPQAAPGVPVVTATAPTMAPARAAAPAVTPMPPAAPETPPAAAPLTITVQPGFTLWRIARENFGDGVLYVKVFEANKAQIRDPDLIYPGQVFTIPD